MHLTINTLLLDCCFSVGKSVYGEHPDDHPHLRAHVDRCVKKGIYDPDIVNQYTLEEWDKLNGYIDHDRDYRLHMQVFVRLLINISYKIEVWRDL